ncbi:piggyBac transposable element-derived protein 4-like [Scleropages formosus]|nr:piggyBac transposable element-derived protein 4-like [Scleropages formosus]
MFGDLLHNPLYKATMAVGRFEDILHVLCFDDKKTRASRREKDKMAPFRCIWELFLVNCRKRFSPSDCVTVDEQLVPFKGRCRFLQYMPRKPAKYGIKIFWLCDARVPYAIDGIVYTGREPGKEIRKNVGENVVRQLCSGIRNTGRSITTDNFFTSVGLAESLKELGLGLVGTLRQNKVEIPPVMKPSESRKVYSSEFGFNGSTTMVSYVPKRKKAVVLLSTVHHDKAVDEDSQKRKPEIITFYNQTKGGVDVVDQMVRTYTCKRKTRRWTMVLWYNVLDVATLNAYTFFTSQHPECYRGVPSARRHFLKELTLQLITPYMKIRLENTRGLPKQTVEAMERCGVTKSESLPMGENEENQLKKRKRCHMCPSSKDRKTQTYCMKCYVPVCRDHRQKKVICVKCIEGKTK